MSKLKKVFHNASFVLAVFLVLSLVNITFAQGIVTSDVVGTVSEIDKYGNVHTDIPETTIFEYGFEIGDMLLLKLDGTSVIAPFVTTYGDVDRGNPLVRTTSGHVQLAINYGNFAKTYNLEIGDTITIELKEKGAYKSELEIRHLVRTDNRDDYASDEIFANFREVTIGNIGEGKLYRSSHPSIDDPRSPYASKLMEKAGIQTVINLSDSQEELMNNLQYSSYYKMIYDQGNLIALSMGVDPMSDDFAKKMKEGLLFMIEKEPPYLVHCVEGKDRAGITVALLGTMMDASTEEVYNDYVKSYENYYNVEKGTPAYEAVERIISDLFIEMNDGDQVDDSNIKEVAIKYLTERVGLTNEQIYQLQQKLKQEEKKEGLGTKTMAEIKKVRNEIKTEAEGEIIKYQEESFYSEDDFAVILENENEFKSQLIEGFKQEIVNAIAQNCRVVLNESRRSAILECDIKGARYATNPDMYNMHFLLNGTKRFGFDLYGFEEHEKELVYDGKVDGVPTKIVFKFPYIINHCHEHVWPD